MQPRPSLARLLASACGALIIILVVLALAGCAILRVVGGQRTQSALARLKASGVPTTWQEAIPPPVPDDENAALLYQNAFAHIVLDRSEDDWSALGWYMSGRPDKRREFEQQVAEILAANAEALRLAAEAGKRPKYRFPHNWKDPRSVFHREVNSFKTLSRLANAQAVFRAAHGDAQGALEAWSINLAIVKHLKSDPMLTLHFTAYSILGGAARSLPQVLEQTGPGAEQCRSLAQALGRLDLEAGFVRGLETARTIQLFYLELARQDPRGLFGQASGSSPYARFQIAIRNGLAKVAYPFVSALDESATLQAHERYITLARKPYRESAGQFAALKDTVPPYAPVTRIMAPARAAAVVAREKAIARVRLMRTALGLAAYRSEHGEYPESLARLRKALNWDVPEDPFSGRDFIYRREAEGYLLYSLGPDLDDDGGQPLRVMGAALGPHTWEGDIVWRMRR